jgi:D-sedoheptulose 7-phosphate isomerase
MEQDTFRSYAVRLNELLETYDWAAILPLAESLRQAIRDNRSVFICGNGGSAANAMHLANDFLYGIAKDRAKAMRVEALPANTSVITCLANDVGYSEIFAHQLQAKAGEGDILIVLSGSGESPNVIRALETARILRMKTFAILGFSGGQCKKLADNSIHFAFDDMQTCEDLQVIVGHMLMKWLIANPVPLEV